MNDLDSFVCDQANKLLDLYLPPEGNMSEDQIENGVRRYITGVLTPLFEPTAAMPEADRPAIITTVVGAIRDQVRMMAEIALEHKEPENDQ